MLPSPPVPYVFCASEGKSVKTANISVAAAAAAAAV